MSAQAPAVLLEHHLKALKLPTILREYKTLARVCSEERADYPTYLLRLSERELIETMLAEAPPAVPNVAIKELAMTP